ncbi:MAG: nuclear transport factor 2 family protein [Candidatus Binatia bacterium]|jgi:ketosteroid isomerase-like protein|nr:nuclear transport factor 2 family protein [Candidatus Binatia bacterium]
MSKQESEVFDDNSTFYKAFESFDINMMEKVWLKEGYIRCIHPGWSLLKGWEPVMDSWRRIFEGAEEMRFGLTEVTVQLRDTLAWVTLYENISSRVEGQSSWGLIFSTNIFRRREPGGWFIILHHGSPVVAPAQEPQSTLH